MIFLIVEGTLLWSLVKLPRPPRRPGGRADPRQHAARDRLDGRRGADPGRADGRDVRLPARHREPAASPARTGLQASQARFASIDQPGAARAAGPTCASRSTASSTCGATTTPASDKLFSYYDDGRAGRHDGRARDHRLRRDPLVVDPQARRQGRRRAGPRERDLVQDPGRPGRHRLRGPVRRAVRRRPRRHARRGAGRSRRTSTRRWAERQAQRHRAVRQAARRAAQGAARARRAPDGSRNRSEPPQVARPEVVLHGLKPAAARLAGLADHHRSQEDRDPLPVRDLPVLHARAASRR